MKSRRPGIYALVNAVNGRFYVGSSVYLPNRKSRHLRELAAGTHPNAALRAAAAKYGAGAFRWVVIAEVAEEDLRATEERLLARLVGHPLCYNQSARADGAQPGRTLSAAARATLSAAMAERWQAHRQEMLEQARRVGDGLRGRKRPDVAKRMMGRPLSHAHAEKIRHAMNRPEVRARMSDAAKAYRRTPEGRAAILSVAARGRAARWGASR